MKEKDKQIQKLKEETLDQEKRYNNLMSENQFLNECHRKSAIEIEKVIFYILKMAILIVL